MHRSGGCNHVDMAPGSAPYSRRFSAPFQTAGKFYYSVSAICTLTPRNPCSQDHELNYRMKAGMGSTRLYGSPCIVGHLALGVPPACRKCVCSKCKSCNTSVPLSYSLRLFSAPGSINLKQNLGIFQEQHQAESFWFWTLRPWPLLVTRAVFLVIRLETLQQLETWPAARSLAFSNTSENTPAATALVHLPLKKQLCLNKIHIY